MSSLENCRVAVIGARGIGKHHAKWWSVEGADVVAVVGTSPDSIAETEAELGQLFDYRGTGYTSVDAMLDAAGPDVVDVCSPDPFHRAHVRTALEAGCHVLCEKPFVYDAALDHETLITQARELVALAASRGLLLGICTQYVVGMRFFLDLWRERFGNEPIESFRGELASPHVGKRPTLRDIWIDLAPHPLSMLQTLVPGGAIEWGTVLFDQEESRGRARFNAVEAGGRRIACEMAVAKTSGSPTHVRRAALNDYSFEVEPGRGLDGNYCARIVTPEDTHERPDLMRLVVRDFLRGEPAADGAMALQNTEWLLGMLDAAPMASVDTAS